MSEYKVLYIDDEKTDSDQFERNLTGELTVQTIDFINTSYDEIVSFLEKKDFDYLIVDYHLHEKSNCGFNGDKIVVEFAIKFPHFPVMLLTNYDNQALTNVEGFDLEKIHSKREYIDDHIKEAFVKRIKRKVDEYRSSVQHAEERIEELAEKKNSGEILNAEEEDEVIKLDTFLDEVLSGESKKIPNQIKETNEEKIHLLLEKTSNLISKLENYEKVSGT